MDSSKDVDSQIVTDGAHDSRLICEKNGILELNVGGQYFSTTRETLSAAGHSFFSGLISGSFGILRDSKGCVFIDRDREYMNFFFWNLHRTVAATSWICSDTACVAPNHTLIMIFLSN